MPSIIQRTARHTLPDDRKAFIFDLDGVLVDTATFHYQAWKRLAHSLEIDFTWQQNEKLKGVSRQQSLDYLLQWGNVTLPSAEKEQLAARKNGWYLELVAGMTHWDVLPGAWHLLKAARAKGIRTALGSASKNAQLVLEQTRLTDCLDAVIDGNSVLLSKPHPEVFLKAADALGIAPSDCLVFEDAQAGIDAAIAAGMQVVGIGSATDLIGTDVIVPGLVDLTI